MLLSLYSPNISYLASKFLCNFTPNLFYKSRTDARIARHYYAISREFEEALVDEERRCQPLLDELLQEDEKLRLFALKNQGQFRNASLKHACISRCKNSAEWKAWSKLKGMKAEDAQIEYIKLLNYLMQKYNIGRWI